MFIPRRNTPEQKYCGKDKCLRARRADWQRRKLKHDPDNCEYQATARKRWREAHPDYMPNYRKNHPAYREKERKRSKEKRLLKKTAVGKMAVTPPSERVVNMDLSGTQPFGKSAYYKLYPLSGNGVVSMDPYIVQLTVVEQDMVHVGSS